jgi:hypothetical protein
MEAVTCPGCLKQYDIPTNAEGRVLKCACGTGFRFSTLALESTVEPSGSSPVSASEQFDFDSVPSFIPPTRNTAAPSRPLSQTASLPPLSGWQRLVDRSFRVSAIATPLLIAGITYFQWDMRRPSAETNRVIFAMVALVVSGAICTILAIKGIRFDCESHRHRLKGLYIIGLGLLFGFCGACCVYLTSHGKRAASNSIYAFVAFSFCGLATIYGLLQVVTGSDIRSAIAFRTL